jgi:hypothetical protein
LLSVAAAGVNANAARGDADGVMEVMRRVRLLAEPAGGSLPAEFTLVWARALQQLDPAFAQMLGLQMLSELRMDGEAPTDQVFYAAHEVLAATLNLGDSAAADRMANEWIPLALAADGGEGAQLWIELLDGHSAESE